MRHSFKAICVALFLASVAGCASVPASLQLINAANTQQMQALQAILARHRGPVILAGDFNNWSEERNAVVQNMASALQLVAIPYTNHNRTRVFGHAIDHIYYRGLDVISHQSIDVTSSDHNPIQVLFRFHTQQLAGQSP